MSEPQYLQFGVIWREFGARDKRASCRKMDQFIFFVHQSQKLKKMEIIKNKKNFF